MLAQLAGDAARKEAQAQAVEEVAAAVKQEEERKALRALATKPTRKQAKAAAMEAAALAAKQASIPTCLPARPLCCLVCAIRPPTRNARNALAPCAPQDEERQKLRDLASRTARKARQAARQGTVLRSARDGARGGVEELCDAFLQNLDALAKESQEPHDVR